MRLQNDRTLDDTDHRLLTLLQANARRSATALAKELSLSRTAVQARIVRLEREGVITAYVPVLGKPLNNGLQAVVTLVLNRSEESSARKARGRAAEGAHPRSCEAPPSMQRPPPR